MMAEWRKRLAEAPDHFAGRLVDDKSEPVAGATVLYIVHREPKGPSYHATTDDDGRFEFRDLEEFDRIGGQLWFLLPHGGIFGSRRGDIVKVPSLGSVVLHVTRPDGEPARGATFVPSSLGELRQFSPIPEILRDSLQIQTDDHGVATFVGYPHGAQLFFEITDERFARLLPRAWPTVGDDMPFEVQVRPGGAISGRVLHANGSPASNVRVLCTNQQQLGASAEAETDQNGRFTVKQLQEGIYDVAFDLEEMEVDWTARAIRNLFVGVNHPIADVEVELEKGPLITGRISLKKSKLPLSGVGVSVRGPGNPSNPFGPRACTDEQGIYRIYGSCRKTPCSHIVGNRPGAHIQ